MTSTPSAHRRVVIVGDSGSGKTTVASRTAHTLGLAHVELDALFHEPGWQQADPEVFRQRVAQVAAQDAWVADGNYSGRVQDLLWPRATAIVWLDLPLAVTVPRLLRRTLTRAVGRVELWNGNRERLRHVLHPEHPLWWTLRRHRDRRRSYQKHMDERWVRLTSQTEIDRWLNSLSRR